MRFLIYYLNLVRKLDGVDLNLASFLTVFRLEFFRISESYFSTLVNSHNKKRKEILIIF